MKSDLVSNKGEGKKSFLYKLGMGLLILSLLVWLIPVITPFTPLPAKIKAGVITGSILIAEVMFWLGALLVGKEVAKKFKSYLNPKNWRRVWRKKHEKERDNGGDQSNH